MQKKKIKIISILLILLILTMYSKSIYAISSSGGYNILSYDIDIIVNDDNSFDITEKIKVYFTSARHGIYRKIPLRNSIKRLDGTTNTNRAKITDIKVSDYYSLSKENGYQVIKIGNKNSTVKGKQTYTIKYKYNIGKDPLKDIDEFYFNLIGPEWDTSINNVTFKITMPKEFDASKLGFSSGIINSTNSDNVTYTVNGNVITGELLGKIGHLEALTVRITLPEGYFVNAKDIRQGYAYIMIIIPLILLIISISLCYKEIKSNKHNKIIETVEFYPPEGYNSAEIGFLYKGNAVDKDVVSLLIYLANKGFLEICELGKTSFTIKKLKEYDGNNESEQIFLNGLFKDGRNEVCASELNENFYITISKIKNKLNSTKNEYQIFNKSKSLIVIAMAIISTLIFAIIPSIIEYSYFEVGSIIGRFIITIFLTAIIVILLSKKIKIAPKIIFLVILSIVIFLNLKMETFAFNKEFIPNGMIYLISAIINELCIIGMFKICSKIPVRTKKGIILLGKIRGFKNFLETAEKERLEAMVMENPTYFYDILPYTYVLGVSDKWIKKFETIAIKPPNWYNSENVFDIQDFMDSKIKYANKTMTSHPVSSYSGGSYSGGSYGGSDSSGGRNFRRRLRRRRRRLLVKISINLYNSPKVNAVHFWAKLMCHHFQSIHPHSQFYKKNLYHA